MVSATTQNQTSIQGTLLITKSDVARWLDMATCIAAVEDALRLHAEGKSLPPGILGFHVEGGGFHIKAAGLIQERPYFAAKTNANFSKNPERFGLPTIQGVVFLADAERGSPLALMDSIEITAKRTAAASAIAAKHLAHDDSHIVTICGCGVQSRAQLEAIAQVRSIRQAYAYDIDNSRAARFAAEQSKAFGFEISATSDLAAATGSSDIVITCTSSRKPFLMRDWVKPGTFVAAVGADAEDKTELEPALLRGVTLVADHIEQCASIGELHHAIDAGVASRASVHAELHELVARTKRGRSTAEEITIFDSTGTALQDVAAALAVYRKVQATGEGRYIDFAG